MPAEVIVPAQVAQASMFAAHEEVVNPKDPKKLDEAKKTWYNFLEKTKKERTFTQGKLTYKLSRDGGGEAQYWQRREQLEFDETFIDDEMVFTPYRRHLGLEVVHADLEDRGYIVMPDEKRGENLGQKISRADGQILVDYFKEQIQDRRNRWIRTLDEDLLFNNGNPLGPTSLDDLMPENPTIGTIGGKDRSDPLFRHQVKLGSTTGASGSIERDLVRLKRLAEENTEDFPAEIDFLMAGDDWIDAYVDYAKANGLRYQRRVDEVTGVDIAFPDARIEWHGIPVVRNPTFRRLESKGKYTGTPWGKRCYGLSSKTWELAYQKNKWFHFSAPMDPSDMRVSRMSWTGRHCLWNKNIQVNFLNTIS